MTRRAEKRRAVFLDRDGVLNRVTLRDGRSFPPDRIEDFQLFDGVVSAVRRLRDAGYAIVVCTNQPDVATGRQSSATVEAMHAKLREWLPIDDIRTCYHTDAHDCRCRKPRPGMLVAAAEALGIDLADSYMVGDRWRDVEAAQAAGCIAIFIDAGYRERQPSQPFVRVGSLVEAADFILNRDNLRQEKCHAPHMTSP